MRNSHMNHQRWLLFRAEPSRYTWSRSWQWTCSERRTCNRLQRHLRHLNVCLPRMKVWCILLICHSYSLNNRTSSCDTHIVGCATNVKYRREKEGHHPRKRKKERATRTKRRRRRAWKKRCPSSIALSKGFREKGKIHHINAMSSKTTRQRVTLLFPKKLEKTKNRLQKASN